MEKDLQTFWITGIILVFCGNNIFARLIGIALLGAWLYFTLNPQPKQNMKKEIKEKIKRFKDFKMPVEVKGTGEVLSWTVGDIIVMLDYLAEEIEKLKKVGQSKRNNK